MKAICIDSANKPENISDYEWIEEGTVYTIIEVVEMGLQKGKLGIALEEIELTDASAPYKYYSLERFLLVPDDMTMTVENVMDSIISQLMAIYFWYKVAQVSSFAYTVFIGPFEAELKGLLWPFFI